MLYISVKSLQTRTIRFGCMAKTLPKMEQSHFVLAIFDRRLH